MAERAIEPPPKIDLIGQIDPKKSIDMHPIWRKWIDRLSFMMLRQFTYTPTLTPSAVGANITSEQTFTVNGITTNDIIVVTKPTHQPGLGIVNARGSADNTLAITFMNTTGGSITPTSETYLIMATRK